MIPGSVVRRRGGAWQWVVGGLLLALTAVLGSSGAAASPRGLLVGVPGGWTLLWAIVFVVALVAWGRGARALGIGLGLLPLVPGILLGAPVPGLAAWTGPPLWALAGAAAVLLMWSRPSPRWISAVFFPLVLLVHGATAARVQQRIGPEGDGPHYLMVTDSLLRDGDLNLEQDFAERRYRSFYAGDLEPHRRVRGRHGETYSIHGIGLSLLLLPAYAVGGYAGASFFMALLSALLALEVRSLLRGWLGRGPRSELVAWVVAFSPPVLYYAGVIFTEIPAALLIAFCLRHAKQAGQLGAPRALAVGLAIAALPWLNVRYVLPAALLLAFVAIARPSCRRAVALLLPSLASALALAAYHAALYGFFDPRRVYGSAPDFGVGNFPTGLLGLLFDQEFGLLPYAPVFVLALHGLPRLRRAGWRSAALSWGLVLGVVGTAAAWHMWRGGFNPPARFLVPIIPVLALGVGAALSRAPRVGAALLIGWGLWTGVTGAVDPDLVHRDRDGTAPLFRMASGAEEWAGLLPGYVRPPTAWAYARPHSDRHSLSLIWALALGLAAFGPRRPRGLRARLAAGVGLLLLVTTAAAALSTARSEGRNAVRLVGRSGLELPTLRLVSEAAWQGSDLMQADYGARDLGNGLTLGNRLPLPPGWYALEITTVPGAVAKLPRLEIRPDRHAERRRVRNMEAVDGGLRAAFEVRAGDSAVKLGVRHGSPFRLLGVRLWRVSPPSGRAGR